MDWDEKSIKLYVDNVLMNIQDLEKTYNTINPASKSISSAALHFGRNGNWR